jgi:hypothetical protein
MKCKKKKLFCAFIDFAAAYDKLIMVNGIKKIGSTLLPLFL